MPYRRFRRLLPLLSALALVGGAVMWGSGVQALTSSTAQGTTSQGTVPQADWRGKLSPLLPQSGQVAQVMETRPKFSITEIRRRVLDLGGNPQVLDQVLISVQRGAALRYDKSINISESNFHKLLIFQQTLQGSGRVVKLSVQFTGNRLTFGDLGGTPLLRGISLDLSTGEMHFPEGFSASPEAFVITAAEATKADDPLGKRSGYVWKVLGNNAVTQTALKGSFFLLGLSDGSVLISYNRNGILHGRSGTGSQILNFGPGTPPASNLLTPR